MKELSLEKFDPSKEHLLSLVKEAKSVDITDVSAVKSVRITLRDTRLAIAEKGKEMRSDALAFQKAVIAKEKELIAIITPEEERLESVEEDFKKLERAKKLPERRAAIEATGYISPVQPFATDDELCGMTDLEFEKFRLSCIEKRIHADAEAARIEAEKKAAAERAEREAEQAKIAEQQRKEREAFEAEKRAEQAKIEKEKREIFLAQEKIRLEHEAKIKAEADAKAKAEREEAQAKAEKARIELEEKQQQEREEFKKLMQKHGATTEAIKAGEFIIVQAKLYKLCK